MIRLLFLIRSLESGGAERQLIELAKGLDKTRFSITLATFYDGGVLWPEIQGVEGVRVVSLHKKGRWDMLPFVWRLWRLVRKVKPHIVHGYMGVANELGLVTGKTVGAKSVWGLRASNMKAVPYDRVSDWSYRAGAWLSRFADLIIVNSQAGKRHHISRGYNDKHMVVIPNGIDTERFHPDCEAGRQVREEWGIAEGEQLIGLVARIDPMKDHPTFLRAASILAQERPKVRFVCVGGGSAAYEQQMWALGEELRLGEHLIWAGARNDTPSVYNALDITTSSSAYGEGFSNVLGEAMACGVSCVTTDVGDSALIVGNAEQVVPRADPQALAAAWARLLDLGCEQRAALGTAARERTVSEFNSQHLASKTASALVSLLR